jgi:hypothetical protein
VSDSRASAVRSCGVSRERAGRLCCDEDVSEGGSGFRHIPVQDPVGGCGGAEESQGRSGRVGDWLDTKTWSRRLGVVMVLL